MKTKFVTGMGLVEIDIKKKENQGKYDDFFSYLRLHTIARILRKVCNYRKKPYPILCTKISESSTNTNKQ